MQEPLKTELKEEIIHPLILTVKLNDAAFHFFNDLRQTYFPPERNYLKAHLTLFHALPGEKYAEIADELSQLAGATSRLELQPVEWKFIGKGVAFVFQSDELKRLHKNLKKRWKPYLTPQDAQGLWPHITIQNKVLPAEGKNTLQQVQDMQPPHVEITGFQLWEYHQGPWQWVKDFPILSDA